MGNAKNNFTIDRDVNVVIIHKTWHVHSIGGRLHRNFTKDYGDIPVAHWNDVTGKMEMVVNPRGYAYAARNRYAYLKDKRKG